MFELTKKQVADGLNISVATVEAWSKQGLKFTRRAGKNWYALRDLVDYLLHRDGGKALDPRQEQAALHKENRLMRRVQRQQLEGELVPVDEVTMMITAHAAAARAKFLALPTKLATVAVSCQGLEEIQQGATLLVHEALDEMARTDITDYLQEPQPAMAEA